MLLALFAQPIRLNLVIAVVLDNFIDNAQLEGFLKTSNFVDLLRMVITLRVGRGGRWGSGPEAGRGSTMTDWARRLRQGGAAQSSA